MKWNPDRSFKSPSEALTFIQDRFLIPRQERRWLPAESGLLLPREGPPYIFRGECGGFETTIATKDRPGTFEGLSEEDRNTLERLLFSLCKRLMLRQDLQPTAGNQMCCAIRRGQMRVSSQPHWFLIDCRIGSSGAITRAPASKFRATPYSSTRTQDYIRIYAHHRLHVLPAHRMCEGPQLRRGNLALHQVASLFMRAFVCPHRKCGNF